VHQLWLDHEGSVWIGHNATGVDQLKRTTFRSLDARQGLTHDVVTGIFQDRRGNMWIGTEQGLNLLAAEGGILQFTKKNGLEAEMVFTICEDSAGDIWVGSLRGLSRYGNGTFTRFTSQNGLPSSIIWCTYRDRAGRLWIGTRQGLATFQNGAFEVFNHDNANLSHDDVRSLCEDREGHLWVGTSYGLNRLVNGRFEQYRNASDNNPFKQVLTLHADAEGDLWIGTMDKGLFRHRQGRFVQFNTRNGLHDDLVHQILEDDTGHLWLTCNRGVYRVSKNNLEAVAAGQTERVECQVFDESDGLPTLQCNGTIQPAGWKAQDGRLWFSTLKGAAIIDPDHMQRNGTPPPVRIDTVRVDAVPRAPGPELIIEPGVDRIEVQFTALSFVDPRKVAFKYRLEGFDRKWVDSHELRSAFYTHLPPGRYQFQVRACNNDGVWNEEGASFAMTVVPPWWQASWFIVLSFLAFSGSLAGAVRYISLRRSRRRMEEIQRAHELERERARIARDMHDSLGASLVKISLMGEAAETRLPNVEETRTHLQRISASAREVVRSLDEIVWAINPRNDTLENLANYVCHFAQEQFEFAQTRCHFDLPKVFPMVELSAECRHNVFLVIKESLNNVLKHANATDVWVRFETREDTLVVQVEDNGIGVSPEAKRVFGNGLANMRKRMEMQGGTWDMLTRKGGKGTVVELRLPF
jgi:signal transduction histidine kinase/streptogramin lyase